MQIPKILPLVDIKHTVELLSNLTGTRVIEIDGVFPTYLETRFSPYYRSCSLNCQSCEKWLLLVASCNCRINPRLIIYEHTIQNTNWSRVDFHFSPFNEITKVSCKRTYFSSTDEETVFDFVTPRTSKMSKIVQMATSPMNIFISFCILTVSLLRTRNERQHVNKISFRCAWRVRFQFYHPDYFLGVKSTSVSRRQCIVDFTLLFQTGNFSNHRYSRFCVTHRKRGAVIRYFFLFLFPPFLIGYFNIERVDISFFRIEFDKKKKKEKKGDPFVCATFVRKNVQTFSTQSIKFIKRSMLSR